MRIKFKLPERNSDYGRSFYLTRRIIKKCTRIKLKKSLRHYFNIHLPSHISKISAFSKRKDIKVKELYPEEWFHMPKSVDINGASHKGKGFNAYKAKVPKTYILTIDKGKHIIGDIDVYTNDNKVIKEITDHPDKENRTLGKKLAISI